MAGRILTLKKYWNLKFAEVDPGVSFQLACGWHSSWIDPHSRGWPHGPQQWTIWRQCLWTLSTQITALVILQSVLCHLLSVPHIPSIPTHKMLHISPFVKTRITGPYSAEHFIPSCLTAWMHYLPLLGSAVPDPRVFFRNNEGEQSFSKKKVIQKRKVNKLNKMQVEKVHDSWLQIQEGENRKFRILTA